MPILRAHLVDLKYIQEEAIIVELFCRDESGALLVLRDYYRPNFYALPKPNADVILLRSRINRIHLDERRHVTATQEVKKRINGKEENFIKIFVSKPDGIPEIKKQVSLSPEIINCFEHDISLTRKYMLENKLVPFSVFEAEVVGTSETEYGLPVYKLVKFLNRDITSERPKLMSISFMFSSEPSSDNQILGSSLVMVDDESLVTWKSTTFISKSLIRVNDEEGLLLAVKNLIEEKKPDILLFDDKIFGLQSLKDRAARYGIRFTICFDHSEPYYSSHIKKTRTVGVNEVFMRRLVRNYVKFSLTDKKLREMYKAVTEIMPVVALASEEEDEQCFSVLLAKAKLNHSLFVELYPGLVELFRLISLRPADMLNFSVKSAIDWLFVKSSIEVNNIVINKGSMFDEGARAESDKYQPVIDPLPGIYSGVVRIDLYSLYHTLIINHNLSNETISCSCCEGICEKNRGLLPTVLNDLTERVHRINQALSKSNNDILEKRKAILDRLLSSFYEYLNNPASRWHSKELCSKLNSLARETILHLVKSINERSSVVYSDYHEIYIKLDEPREELLQKIQEISSDLKNISMSSSFGTGIFLPRTEIFQKKRIVLVDSNDHIFTRNVVGKSYPRYIRDSIHDVIGMMIDKKLNQQIVTAVRKKIVMLSRKHVAVANLVMKARFFKHKADYHDRTIFKTLLNELEALGYVYEQGMVIDYIIVPGNDFYYKRAKVFRPGAVSDYDAGYYINRQLLPTLKDLLEIKGITIQDIKQPKKQESLDSFI